MLLAKLLRLKKASHKLGTEHKSLAQSVNGFMKSTQGDQCPEIGFVQKSWFFVKIVVRWHYSEIWTKASEIQTNPKFWKPDCCWVSEYQISSYFWHLLYTFFKDVNELHLNECTESHIRCLEIASGLQKLNLNGAVNLQGNLQSLGKVSVGKVAPWQSVYIKISNWILG